MTKKLVSLLVAALMVLTLLPVAALAKTSVEGPESARIIDKHHVTKKLTEAAKAAEVPARDDVVLTDLILDQDFETSMSGWWTLNADGNTATYGSNDWSNWRWLALTDSDGNNLAHGGEGALYSVSWWGSAFDQDNWVITPELTLNTTGYCLSYYASSLDASYPDHLQVLVGESGTAYDSDGNIDTSAWVSLIDLYEVAAEYTQTTIDLSAYSGKTIKIAFRHLDNNQYGVALDDIQVGLGEGAQIIDDTGVTISDATLDLGLTYGYQLSATVEPADATYTNVTWSSSDPSVVAVNNAGGVLALAVGTATITATSRSGYTASCEVTVTQGQYTFEDDFIAYSIYDIDSSASNESWYIMDRYGYAIEYAAQGDDILVSEYCFDGKLYAYVENADETVDFVSYDTTNEFTKTVIAANVSDMPEWMAYDFDNDVMYGGWYHGTSTAISNFNVAEVDLTDGTEGALLIDLYNEPYSDDENWGLAPSLGTYYGNGIFLIYEYDMILMFSADYNGQGFALGMLDSQNQLSIEDQIGKIGNYYQKMYFNPFDGMLYWAGIVTPASCNMIVTDLYSGVSVVSGYTSENDEPSYGMEVTALFVPYVPQTVTYTVTFIDGLTGLTIAEVEVEEGGAAEAPEAPVHEGYTFDCWDPADFSNVTENMYVTALYTPNNYTLTVNYVDAQGNKLAAAHIETVAYGSSYSVASPEIPGYTPNYAVVEGTMGAGNEEITVTYTPNNYTLTINYVDAQGNKLAPAYTATVAYGESYSVASPEIEGYTPDQAVVEGVMGAANVEVNVVYTANETPVEVLPGDANADGVLTSADLSALFAYVMNAGSLTEQGLLNADVNGDGVINTLDVTVLAQLIFGA